MDTLIRSKRSVDNELFLYFIIQEISHVHENIDIDLNSLKFGS